LKEFSLAIVIVGELDYCIKYRNDKFNHQFNHLFPSNEDGIDLTCEFKVREDMEEIKGLLKNTEL